MDPAGSFMKLTGRRAAKGPPDEAQDELHAYVRGPLWPRPVLHALLAVFGVSALLTGGRHKRVIRGTMEGQAEEARCGT